MSERRRDLWIALNYLGIVTIVFFGLQNLSGSLPGAFMSSQDCIKTMANARDLHSSEVAAREMADNLISGEGGAEFLHRLLSILLMFLAAISIFNLILARCVDRRLLFIGANFCTLAVISLFGLRLLVDDPWPDYFWSAGKIVQKILSTHQLDYARRASADLERDFLIFWASGRQRSLETLGILAILAAMDFLNVKIITKRASQARK